MGDASCSAPRYGSGDIAGGNNDGSFDDAGSGTAGCVAGPAASQCEVCANADCCMQLLTCTASPTGCGNLLSCVDGCGDSACISNCEGTYLTAAALFNEVESCLNLKCPICNESGVGDPCVPGVSACVAGLFCNGLWCTRSCTSASANCAGIGPAGGNYLGEPNACIPTASGIVCAPECTTTTDCADFPNTNCRSTTSLEEVAILVCSDVGDGG
jgi:hypothetical protein